MTKIVVGGWRDQKYDPMTGRMMFSLYSLKSLGRSFGITPQARTLVQVEKDRPLHTFL